ncbi:Radial spoke head protein 9 [Thoreauomyces humboldtii]|nr:Radial spoke head protein 9 [Thoreauomyces humboldtii]
MSFLSLDDAPYFSLAGFTLNIEEKSALSSSLQVKKEQEKLGDIWLWGKVLGVQRDYLVAQAIGNDAFDRKFYYSIDLVNWLQLPEVTAADMDKMTTVQVRFSGDPAFEYTIGETRDLFGSAAPEGSEDGEESTINEEKRLAGTVALINYETEIVPRGAYYRDTLHKLQKNAAFSGIPTSELGQLTNYLHFREGFNVNKKTLLERANAFDESIDVFESISTDTPKGVWSCQMERTGSVAILRSLLWPGFTFFHTSSPPKWGSMYYGSGQRNLNTGFML